MGGRPAEPFADPHGRDLGHLGGNRGATGRRRKRDLGHAFDLIDPALEHRIDHGAISRDERLEFDGQSLIAGGPLRLPAGPGVRQQRVVLNIFLLPPTGEDGRQPIASLDRSRRQFGGIATRPEPGHHCGGVLPRQDPGLHPGSGSGNRLERRTGFRPPGRSVEAQYPHGEPVRPLGLFDESRHDVRHEGLDVGRVETGKLAISRRERCRAPAVPGGVARLLENPVDHMLLAVGTGGCHEWLQIVGLPDLAHIAGDLGREGPAGQQGDAQGEAYRRVSPRSHHRRLSLQSRGPAAQSNRASTRLALWPPNPKLLLMATSTRASRAWLGV